MTLYSLSAPGKQERAELHPVLRTEIMRKGTCLDSFQWLPSVTFYLKVIYSVMPHLLRIWNAFWPFEDCYLLGFIFAQFFYCLKLPCMKLYKHALLQIKHPCFTRDLGPLHPSLRLQSRGPGLQRPWQVAPEQGPGDCRCQADGVTVRTYGGRKCGIIGQMAEKPHHFSTLLHHLFKDQGLLVSHQRIEACLQTVVK